jgi:hypothetical protein
MRSGGNQNDYAEARGCTGLDHPLMHVAWAVHAAPARASSMPWCIGGTRSLNDTQAAGMDVNARSNPLGRIEGMRAHEHAPGRAPVARVHPKRCLEHVGNEDEGERERPRYVLSTRCGKWFGGTSNVAPGSRGGERIARCRRSPAR